MRVIPTILVQCLLSALCFSDLDTLTEYYLNEREPTQIRLTRANSENVSVDAPFLRVEIEKGAYTLGQECCVLIQAAGYARGAEPLTAVSAHIQSSRVTNISVSDIVCVLFDQDMSPIVHVTTQAVFLSASHQPTAIHAAGCGIGHALAQDSKRGVVPLLCGIHTGSTCVFSLGLICPWTTGVYPCGVT